MRILSYERMKEYYGQEEADKPQFPESVCLNCGKVNNVMLGYDANGLHAMCECGSSYDVDGEVLLTLYLFDFEGSSIDELEEHHELVRQILYQSLDELEKGYELLMDAYEGCTYTLEIKDGNQYTEGYILGVFTSDSIEDDIEELKS